MNKPAHQPPPASEPEVHLRILETTDLHVHIMPHDYLQDQPNNSLGLALTARLIQTARATARNCLLFDNGDFLQGTPLSDWAAEHHDTVDNPMIAAMNALDYDAATLGNHEFNYGLEVLTAALGQADFPVTSANVAYALGQSPEQDDHLCSPRLLLDRQVVATDGSALNLRVGVLGLAPPQIPKWDRFALGDRIKTRDILEAAKAHVTALKADGADLVVALCHSGIASRTHKDGMENAAVPLAALDGIDVVLAGHTHELFPDPQGNSNSAVNHASATLHGKPAVQAGCFGSHLGQIDLQLVKVATGWRIQGHDVKLIPVLQTDVALEPDAAVCNAAQIGHQAILQAMRQPVATTTAPLHSHFALAAPSTGLTLVADAMRAGAKACLAGKPESNLPLLVAIQPHNTARPSQPLDGLNAPPGDLLMRHASELYPYPNEPCMLIANGDIIRLWLENAAKGYNRLTPGEADQPLLNRAVPAYHVDMMFGLTYEIDLSKPVGQRIGGLRLADGRPLEADNAAVIVTTTYRAGGGGGYDMVTRCKTLEVGQITMQTVIINHLRNIESFTPRAESVWRFARLENTQAWFDDAPAASDHLASEELSRCREIGIQPSGMKRFQIDLS